MNIKNDYSYLFNSLNNSNSNAGSSSNLFNAINLSEYSSIKTGSYGKLLKAYYDEAYSDSVDSKNDTNSKKNMLKEDTAVEKLTEVSGNASTLQDSAEKLISRGTDSLFKEKELTVKDAEGKESKVMGYDTDAIYKAVKDFADKYNSFIKSVDDSKLSKLDQEKDQLTVLVSDYAQVLEKAGVTIKEDNTLSVDEKTLKAADISDLKKLFNGNASFTYNVSKKASMIGVTAKSEANSMKNYTSAGNYDQTLTTGNLMDSII